MKPFAKLAFAGLLGLAACTDDMATPLSPAVDARSSTRLSNPSFTRLQPTGEYVLIGAGEGLPANLGDLVAGAGGRIVTAYPEFGVAIVSGPDEAFRAALARARGVESVTPDMVVRWIDQATEGPALNGDVEAEGPQAEVASIGDSNRFYSFQWAPAAIQAPEAWNAGFKGAGVRVAVLDGGIYGSHADLVANIDAGASRSFTTGNWNTDVGTFWHGTHVAGIIASAANTIGTVGIAPEATLVGVKVLHNGSGSFASIINGIVYAATPEASGGAGADVINMSLGASIDSVSAYRAEVRELKKAVDLATKYAHQLGVTVVVSAGNGATNYDVEKDLFKTPAQNQFAISVSATGPIGWAYRNATNFSRPAYYTDYGKSLVDLAGPGGSAGLLVEEGVAQTCVVTGTFVTIGNPCYAFDMVLSTSRGTASTGGYTWAQGTSMAAPAVSAVAALVIQRNGGSMQPDQVRTALQRSAVDLGKPGKDEFYGHGWVNALRAVTQ